MSRKAIVIFGGNLVKDESGKWHTTSYSHGDNFGVMGDQLRVVAAEHLYKDDTSSVIIALGGWGQLKGSGSPAIAEVIKEELMERGVPDEAILIETESGNSYQQLQQFKKIFRDEHLESAVLITNSWHVERVQMMAELDFDLKQMFENKSLRMQGAEDVLLAKDPNTWAEPIKEAYATVAMQERIRREKDGVKQLKEGTYKLG